MTNRKRGRPVGSHIRDDRPLAMVADRIAADPELRPSTAMRQVYGAGTWRGTEKTVVTRWLRKWKVSGAAALEAAQQRRIERDRPVCLPVPATQWPHALAISDEMFTAMLELAQAQEPMRQAMADMAVRLEPMRQALEAMAISVAPTREIVEQMRVSLPPSIVKLHAQIAAAAGSLKIYEIKEAIRQNPIMSDAMMSVVKMRTH